jgi:hypothetical protein
MTMNAHRQHTGLEPLGFTAAVFKKIRSDPVADEMFLLQQRMPCSYSYGVQHHLTALTVAIDGVQCCNEGRKGPAQPQISCPWRPLSSIDSPSSSCCELKLGTCCSVSYHSTDRVTLSLFVLPVFPVSFMSSQCPNPLCSRQTQEQQQQQQPSITATKPPQPPQSSSSPT